MKDLRSFGSPEFVTIEEGIFSGGSGAAVSVISCHVSECASPHIFAVLSVICFGLLSRGHKLGQTVFKDSIDIRLSFDTVLSALMVFLNASV